MLQEVDSSQIFADEEPTVMEVTLREFDALVEDKKHLDELLANPAFINIVQNKYFMLEFDRLSGLLKSSNKSVVADRDIIVAKIVAIGYFEQFMRNLGTVLTGIDNPEQRIELLKQIDEYEKTGEVPNE